MTVTFYVVFQGYFSIIGLNIHLQSIGRSRKGPYNHNSRITMILGSTFMFTSCRPSMFTVTSWFSFLLPPNSYPARTSLLVTFFLCQVNILINWPIRAQYFSNRPITGRYLHLSNQRHAQLWSRFKIAIRLISILPFSINRNDLPGALVLLFYLMHLPRPPELRGHPHQDGDGQEGH